MVNDFYKIIFTTICGFNKFCHLNLYYILAATKETKTKPTPEQQNSSASMITIIVASVGTTLVAVVVIVALIFIKRSKFVTCATYINIQDTMRKWPCRSEKRAWLHRKEIMWFLINIFFTTRSLSRLNKSIMYRLMHVSLLVNLDIYHDSLYGSHYFLRCSCLTPQWFQNIVKYCVIVTYS